MAGPTPPVWPVATRTPFVYFARSIRVIHQQNSPAAGLPPDGATTTKTPGRRALARWLRIVPFLAAVAAVLMVAPIQPASAHARPVRFDPAPGAVLQSAPTSIQAWFTSDLRNAGDTFIRVFDASKKRVDTGTIGLSNDRRNMSIGLQADLPEGAYLVHWSTLDDGDGETFAGCHVFYIGQAAADQAVSKGAALDGGANCPAIEPESSSTVEFTVDVSGSSATVNIATENFTLKTPDGTSRNINTGHFHIYLDMVPLDAMGGHGHDESAGSTAHADGHSADHDAAGAVENPVHWDKTSYTFHDLAPGTHTISVALFYQDHTPFSPPAIASETFTVGGGGGGVETWMLIVGIGAGVAVGIAGGRVLAGSR